VSLHWSNVVLLCSGRRVKNIVFTSGDGKNHEWRRPRVVFEVPTSNVISLLSTVKSVRQSRPSSTTKIVQENNSERSNSTSQCIWIQIFLFVIVIVLPICSSC
jgi:hypothetical protein